MSLPRARYRLQHYKSHFHDRPCCTQIHYTEYTNTQKWKIQTHQDTLQDIASYIRCRTFTKYTGCTSYHTLSTRSTYLLNIQLTICHTFTKLTIMTRTVYCWESIDHRNIEPWELALVIPLLRNINGQGNLTPLFPLFVFFVFFRLLYGLWNIHLRWTLLYLMS